MLKLSQENKSDPKNPIFPPDQNEPQPKKEPPANDNNNPGEPAKGYPPDIYVK